MKRTLHDILTPHLAARSGEWIPSYRLSKQQTEWGWIGSSGERRARELAEAGKHTIGGTTYFIERRMNGRYAEYRVASAQAKPRQVIEHLPNGSVRETFV